jgi:hypothetical protein
VLRFDNAASIEVSALNDQDARKEGDSVIVQATFAI